MIPKGKNAIHGSAAVVLDWAFSGVIKKQEVFDLSLYPRPDYRGILIRTKLIRRIGEGEDGVQQDVAAGFEIFGFGAFGLVVAETAGAGHEDHRRRRHQANLAGVMAGPRNYALVAIAECAAGGFDRRDTARIEYHWRLFPDFLESAFHAMLRGDGIDLRVELRGHFGKRLGVGIANIDGEKYFTRYRVA